MRRFRSFREFWPYYLQEHARSGTRALHYVGTSLTVALLGVAAIGGRTWPLVALPIAGYGFAWIGHFMLEHNRPATFRYPLWSLLADFRMWFRFMTGRIARDLALAGVKRDGTVDPARRL